MNGKFIRKGHIATYPFRIPMSLSSRIDTLGPA
jgi:oxygen-dependent protoporphyrinogen oxidase